MGYDVHITRGTPWWDEAGEPITTREWAAVVAADPCLEPVPAARAVAPGQDAVLEFRSEGLVRLAGHPAGDTHGAWLHWRDGRVTGKNPDPALLGKMREIAGVLGARVQGDDGEYYDE
ncbi:hypothetical protein [Streptomyces sp. NPDC018031]|uniref:hypothetical protein n=1 Tax=Streptomyces sp. NPDC018031 TaxID=3365033 RepID=UPI00379DF03A